MARNKTRYPVSVWVLLLAFGCGAPAEPESQDRAGKGITVAFQPNGEIRISRDGQVVGALPAEYVPLDYPEMPWRGDPAIGMSEDGAIYARIFSSQDGGRSWESRTLDVESLDPPMKGENYDSFGVLGDGTLLWGYQATEPETDFLVRSTDGGESWQPWSHLDKLSPFSRAGGNQNCLLELRDGTLLWPRIARPHPPPPTSFVPAMGGRPGTRNIPCKNGVPKPTWRNWKGEVCWRPSATSVWQSHLVRPASPNT